jgi:flagellar motor switch protein FliN/FliY
MADPRLLPESGVWLAETLSSSLSQSLEAMTSQKPAVEWKAFDPSAPGNEAVEGWLWWEQPISLGKGASFWVGVSQSAWREVGRLALVAAGIDDASDEDCLGTWKEIQIQALSATTQAVGRRLRKDLSCEGGRDVPSAPSMDFAIAVTLKIADTANSLRIGWSKSLQTVLEPESESQPTQHPTGSRQEPASKDGRPSSSSRKAEGARTLDLLLEVELPVSVSFGRAQLPLKDVLKLNSGSIVELNRSISEPVEVIVNNCVVARGEVVVVEGNYGVRIKQIVSREERLRTLY